MKKKISITPGAKVRGWGMMNDYGEFEFIPEETGKNVGRQKVLFEQAGVSVKETKEHILVSLKSKKKKFGELMPALYDLLNSAIERLKNYEI